MINYRVGFRKYIMFTGMTPEELLDEKWKDLMDETKKPWEKEKAEERVRAFNKWLLEEYVIEIGRRKGEKGASPRSALMWCTAVVDFFSRHNLPLTIKLGKEFKGATRGVVRWSLLNVADYTPQNKPSFGN